MKRTLLIPMRGAIALVIPFVSVTSTLAQASVKTNNSATHQGPAPSWSNQIAPILYRNCTTCHHPGGAGPFSLLTYDDARRWSAQILTVTQSRFMPPWLPEPGYGTTFSICMPIPA
jgi:hypothetical protein